MKPKVSVIVPVYNAEYMLEACLNSLLLQTWENKEIIVVNDGSTDKTYDICNQFNKSYNCIKVIHKKNAGVSSARNVGIDHALGEFIIFVDSDDTVTSHYIEELMKWSDYDFVTAGYYWQNSDLIWEKRRFEDTCVSQKDLKKQPSRYLGKYYFGSPWATLMKKKIIDFAQLRFNENIHCGEDILFIFQYLKYAKTIKILSICGYNYFYYPNSLVKKKQKDFWKWKIYVENEILNFFEPCNREEKIALLKREFDVLRDLLRDYSVEMTKQELYDLYVNPFFEESINYTKHKGKLIDRILILSMNHKNYRLYVLSLKIQFFLKRVDSKIKRVVSNLT